MKIEKSIFNKNISTNISFSSMIIKSLYSISIAIMKGVYFTVDFVDKILVFEAKRCNKPCKYLLKIINWKGHGNDISGYYFAFP